MAQEKQKPLILRKRPDAQDAESYLVYADERSVGSIYYSAASAHVQPWFWGLDFFSWQGCGLPQYGRADTKEAAMTAFQETWDSKAK